jgi:hypothetical protein
MNSLRLLRSTKQSKLNLQNVARYGKPLNRWQWVKLISIK